MYFGQAALKTKLIKTKMARINPGHYFIFSSVFQKPATLYG